MIREATTEERELLLQAGYRTWTKGRTYEQYCLDNGKEDAYGTRYVLEAEGRLVCSLILLKLAPLLERPVFGIGSVLTFPGQEGKGYASQLIKGCLELLNQEQSWVFLFSDISPEFYERLGFRSLPQSLQRYPASPCMVHCSEAAWRDLIGGEAAWFPDYF